MVALLPGCPVDKNYTADKIKNVDPETLFQNGLSVPLIKSTKELRADSPINIIEDPEIRNLFKDKDGKYEVSGNYEIVGAISIAQGTVSKSDIGKISLAKLGFTEDGSIAISKDLVFPYSSNHAQYDTITNSLTLNVNDILNSRCDSLKLDV